MIGRTEIAGPEDVGALLQRYARPLRQADAVARENVEIARARHEAEEQDRRRHLLLDSPNAIRYFGERMRRLGAPGSIERQLVPKAWRISLMRSMRCPCRCAVHDSLTWGGGGADSLACQAWLSWR